MPENALEKYEILKAASEDVADTGDLYGGRVLGKKEEERLKKASGLLLSDGRVRMQLKIWKDFWRKADGKNFLWYLMRLIKKFPEFP